MALREHGAQTQLCIIGLLRPEVELCHGMYCCAYFFVYMHPKPSLSGHLKGFAIQHNISHNLRKRFKKIESHSASSNLTCRCKAMFLWHRIIQGWWWRLNCTMGPTESRHRPAPQGLVNSEAELHLEAHWVQTKSCTPGTSKPESRAAPWALLSPGTELQHSD